ncbi:unnamed protein product [Urochloa humidicola]
MKFTEEQSSRATTDSALMSSMREPGETRAHGSKCICRWTGPRRDLRCPDRRLARLATSPSRLIPGFPQELWMDGTGREEQREAPEIRGG